MFGTTVLLNGNIYTMDDAQPKVSALVSAEEYISYTGSDEEASRYIGPDTTVINLNGKAVLPGLIEPHVHLPGNSYNVLFNIDLFSANTEEETMERIRSFVKNNPDRESYYGRGFKCTVFGGQESSYGPRKERLDEICKDKPIYLTDFGGHVMWLNSAALEKCGITPETKVPGGVVELDPETGSLWGTLKEEAKYLTPDPKYTLKEKVQAFKHFQDIFNAYGYTSIMALRPSPNSSPVPIFEAVQEVEEAGELHLNICGAREIKAGKPYDPQLTALKELKAEYDSKYITVRTAKVFIDGVVEGVSAFLSEPYGPGAEKGDSYCGEALWNKGALTDCFTKALSAGMNIHVHAIGDEAVSWTVDAMEAAQKTVPGDHRNTITHIQLIKPEDVKRMADLNITGCVNTFWHFKDPSIYFDGELLFLGEERAENQYPLNTLVKNGVRITSSGDHPITPHPNPFTAIQVGVTRNICDAPYYGVSEITDPDDPKYLLNTAERVSVLDMVRAYTVNSAYANYMEDKVGSLTPGKLADLIVLDQDIFQVPPLDISKTKVLTTISHGTIVYTNQE